MTIPAPLRELLAGLADGLIPGADGMPAPGELGIAGAQLDLVLASRPDLEPAGLPDYVEEGLLERVYERGPIYRPTPGR